MICRVSRSLINYGTEGAFDVHMAECRACREDFYEILREYCQALIRAKPQNLDAEERRLRRIVIKRLRLAKGARGN